MVKQTYVPAGKTSVPATLGRDRLDGAVHRLCVDRLAVAGRAELTDVVVGGSGHRGPFSLGLRGLGSRRVSDRRGKREGREHQKVAAIHRLNLPWAPQ